MLLTEQCTALQEKIDYLINKLSEALNNTKASALDKPVNVDLIKDEQRR